MSKTYKGVGGMELPNEEFPAKITRGFYRVLEENAVGAAELGAYRLLANAIRTCDENPGSCVMADAGVCIYPSDAGEQVEPGDTDPGGEEDHGDDGGSGGDTGDHGGDGDDHGGGGIGGDTGDHGSDGGDSGHEGSDGDHDSDGGDPGKPQNPDGVVGYAKLKTMMNVRAEPSSEAELVATYKEDTILAVTQFCEDGWLKIQCEEAGEAYLLNEGGRYASVGKTLYTVKKDDNLWKIAEEQLGDGTRYKEIAEINFLVSNRIRIGMDLVLPEAIPTAEE